MDSSAENTTNNVLRFGVNEAMVDKAIHDSGYPLQLIVAHQLAHDFGLQEEWSYKDADKGTARTIDLVASKLLFDWGKPKLRIRPELVLLIECKQSDLPYVFFLSEIHPWLSEFPTISGLSTRDIKITTDDDPSSWTFTPLHVLELHTHPFLTKAVPFCMTFSKAVRKGEDITLSGSDAYESLVFPILKATSHFDELQHPPSNALYFDCQIVIGVGILDAPMVGIRLTDAGPKSELLPWVRVVRHQPNYAKNETSVFGIDIIHKDYLQVYLSQHLMPFARDFSTLALKHADVLAESRGFISSMGKDCWDNIEPRLQQLNFTDNSKRGITFARNILTIFKKDN